jgi:hypothetical protein
MNSMKEYTSYWVQVQREQAWFDYYRGPSLDSARHALKELKEGKWEREWIPSFRIVERFIVEKVVEDEVPDLKKEGIRVIQEVYEKAKGEV